VEGFVSKAWSTELSRVFELKEEDLLIFSGLDLASGVDLCSEKL
jgi:hypothetical protein